jgi:CRISPR system Cascade subunit CasE
MSAPLCLVRLRPDAEALTQWAVRAGYLPVGADPGYALHAALKASLGDLAPQPFIWREKRDGVELLGYSSAEAAALHSAAALPAIHDPQAAAALGLAGLEARDMPPAWQAGARLSFEVRVRPVVRSRSDAAAKAKGARRHTEIDAAFQASSADGAPRSHEEAYRDWLAPRLSNLGATMIEAQLIGRRQVKILHRPRTGEGARERRLIPGPDALFRGTLEIADPQRFHAGLARGVGRHCAFGFGMLLLAPAGAL